MVGARDVLSLGCGDIKHDCAVAVFADASVVRFAKCVSHFGIKRLMIPCRAAPESALKSDGQVERAAIALSVGLRWSRGGRHRSFGFPSVQERCSRTSFGSVSFSLLCMCRGPVGGPLVSLH